ncbi:hypothetical protein J6TS2_42920 [Heyndrickxia sporothermodurans]|nr:hypothetical protein J6TS2_42920 [Heyndrickxia sporothermodurans]
MLFSYEQVELMKLRQEELERKHRHSREYLVSKESKKSEGK